MNAHAIEKTELNKILSSVATFAVLDGAKKRLQATIPVSGVVEVKRRLSITQESLELLFLETDNDYDLSSGQPLKILQYRPTNNVAKGTIDIM